MIDEDSRRLVHDFRCEHSIIRTAIDILKTQPTVLKKKLFQQMLTRHVASVQLMLTDLRSHTWSKDAFNSSNELFIELTSLLHYFQIEKPNSIPHQIQEEMDSLIHTLQSMGLDD